MAERCESGEPEPDSLSDQAARNTLALNPLIGQRRNLLTPQDEKGAQLFYNFAVTPAIRLITSFQHIWGPVLAQVETRQKGADVFLTRLTID